MKFTNKYPLSNKTKTVFVLHFHSVLSWNCTTKVLILFMWKPVFIISELGRKETHTNVQ